MRIQPVNIMCKPNRLNFAQNNRRPNVDRAITVADLYEMEDRIIKQQKELIKAQNKRLSEAFYSTNKLILSVSLGSYDSEYKYAQNSANKLL